MDKRAELNKRTFLKACAGAIALSADIGWSAPAPSRLRPPSVPLIVTDPYLSIWSSSDSLNDGPTQHWTRRPHRLTSFIRVDGDCYRLMGDEPKGMPAMVQTSCAVHPTRSVYQFEGRGVAVTLTFMTAALPDDLMILSRPLGYLTWSVRSISGGSHTVAVYCDAAPEIAVNEPSQRVRWEKEESGRLTVLRVGCAEQNMMNPRGDDVRIDWGYLYLAAEHDAATTLEIVTRRRAWDQFAAGGVLRSDVQGEQSRLVNDNAPLLAIAFDFGTVAASEISRTAMVAYDELFAVQFFEENLRPYWRRNGASALQLLQLAADEFSEISKRCQAFDSELVEDARRLGGDQYAEICALAYRECIGGNTIVADTNGQPLLFPKENTSNGCIGTVDVIYPMSPQFLLFGPSLSKAMLISNLEYAASARWKFPFAPHDLGTYPQANGQVYGGGESSEANQMPVEETGNMLILLAAVARMEGNGKFAEAYWPTIEKWAAYLKAEGFDPKNQLCTDDFAGHLAHNVNLSAKAIVALGAYALLCEMRQDGRAAGEYRQLAKTYAARWVQQADGGDHFGLTFDQPTATWSQKYNLVWDRILDLGLFPANALKKEMSFYKRHQSRFGLPLDSRRAWTKLDWTLWTATLTGAPADFQTLVEGVWTFANTTPDRVPMSDFYWTQDGQDAGMHARPVVGGVFLRFLYDKQTWDKWAARDRTKASNWAPFPKTGLPA